MKKLLLIIGVLTTVAPVMAVDLDFYGNINLGAWWEMRERYYEDTVGVDTIMWVDTNGVDQIDTTKAYLDADSLPYTFTNILPHGHLGAKLKGDRFGACVEIGVHKNVFEGRISGITEAKLLAREGMFVTLRRWFVEWYMHDVVTLLLGQDYTPVMFVPSNQGYYDDNSFTNTGCVYAGRKPMIQLSLGNFVSGESGFSWEGKFAAINPDTVHIQFRNDLKFSKVEIKAPKFECKGGIYFEQDFFGFNLGGAFGYERFYIGSHSSAAIDELEADECKIPVDCYVIAGGAGFKVGPLHIDFTCAGGQNLGAYGLSITNPWVWRGDMMLEIVEIFFPFHEAVLDTTGIPIDYDLKNSTALEMAGILKIKPLDWLAFEGGAGMVMAEHGYKLYSDKWHDTYAYYGLVTFKLLESLEIAPEFGQYWFGPLVGYGRATYWGVQTRFIF